MITVTLTPLDVQILFHALIDGTSESADLWQRIETAVKARLPVKEESSQTKTQQAIDLIRVHPEWVVKRIAKEIGTSQFSLSRADDFMLEYRIIKKELAAKVFAALPIELRCSFTGCRNKRASPIAKRGLCEDCYAHYAGLVQQGRTTWKELVRLGQVKGTRI